MGTLAYKRSASSQHSLSCLSWAQGRVLCSINVVDFCQHHTTYMVQHKAHAGIGLACQQQYSLGEYIRHLLRLMAHLTAEEMQNRVEFLSAWGERG
jgi:hypothetical protein